MGGLARGVTAGIEWAAFSMVMWRCLFMQYLIKKAAQGRVPQTLYALSLDMDLLQKSFDKVIRELAESAASDEDCEKILSAVPSQYQSLLEELPSDILSTIKSMAEAGLAERRTNHSEFVERNARRWKEGFDLLELQIEIAIEAGESFNDRLRPEAALNEDLVFDLLTRLHAKGCLISKETLVLLKNGYADGAHARWRALHEILVTAMFLASYGKDAAQRYVDHEFVEAYKGASQLNKYQSRLNISGFSEEELDQFKSQYDSVIKFYDKDFSNPYGWAAPFLNKVNPTFFALEEAVGLDHWRPYYKWASQNIHANVKAIKTSLGLSEAVSDVLQVGPSNSGMTDPAHSTAISLSQLTCTLLKVAPNLDGIIMMKVLLSLSDEIGSAFIKCTERKAL